MSKKRKILFGLSIAAFLGPFTQTIYTPSLLEMESYFGVNTFMINLTISIFTFILATSQFIAGPLADTRGRKKVLIPGLLLFTIGSILCLISTDYYTFLIGRAIQAFGISAGSVVAAAVIGDIYSPKDRGRAMSVYQTMVFLGPVLGPVIGSLVSGYIHWQWSFIILILGAIFVLSYNGFTLHETLPKDKVPQKITYHTFKKILFNSSAFAILLLGFTQFYGYYIYLVYLPSLLDSLYQIPVESKGVFYLPLTGGLVIGSLSGSKLQQQYTRKSILISSSYLIGIFVLVFWVCLLFNILSLPILLIFLLGYGVLLGMSLPAQTTVLINIFQGEKGTTIGVYNFVRFSGAAVGPLVGAILHNIGGDLVLYLSLFIILLIAAVVIHKKIYDPYEVNQGQTIVESMK